MIRVTWCECEALMRQGGVGVSCLWLCSLWDSAWMLSGGNTRNILATFGWETPFRLLQQNFRERMLR